MPAIELTSLLKFELSCNYLTSLVNRQPFLQTSMNVAK